MTTLANLVPPGHVLRLCASYERLSHAQCTIPERCRVRICRRCQRNVHWDPSAQIKFLGPEFIMCDICMEEIESI